MSRKPTYKELEQRVKELEGKIAQRHREDEIFLTNRTDISGVEKARETLRPAHDKLKHPLEQKTSKSSQADEQLKLEINERQQAQAVLGNERRQLLSIFNSIDQPVYVSDPDTYVLLYVNEALSTVFGNVIGQKCYAALQHRDSPCPFCTNDRILGENAGRQYIWEFRNQKTHRWFHCIDKAIRWTDGRMVRYEMAIDITERKQVEEALRFKTALLLTQQETSFAGILVVDKEEKIISFNTNFVNMWNIPADVLASRSDEYVLQFVANKMADPKAFLARVKYLYAHRSERSHEELALLDGRIFERYSAPMIGPKGKRYGRIWYFVDITRRKKREEKLRESEHRYRAVVEDLPAMVCRFLPDGTLTFVNSAYCNYFRKKSEDLIGHNFFHFIPGKDKKKVRDHFRTLNKETPMITYRHQVIAPGGAICWQEWTDRALFDDKGQLVEYQSIGRDISEAKRVQLERKKMVRQLQQAQKMEAVGTLAGGIAHDFNNILGAIIGYSDLALAYVPEEDPAHYHLMQILQGGYRARDLVKQILAFSRQTEQEKKPVKLGPLVKEAAKLLRASLPTTIAITTNVSAQKDRVVADPTQIHQVMMNLCANAGHAMRERGGILSISLMEMDLGARALVCPGLSAGPYLKLEVSDTGHGMSATVLERIFDPYFTTKEKGEGTGLGLAVVHGIVKNHGGAIKVTSEPGKGTSFQVFLPRDAATSEEKEEVVSPIPGGNERVLFVDDEDMLVNLARDILERLGYEVVTRTSSVDALESFRADPNKFDIVITDQTMPDLTGVDLAKALMKIRPGIPIILCTGFSEQINPEKAKDLGLSEFLFKPLMTSDLARAIRRALDKERQEN